MVIFLPPALEDLPEGEGGHSADVASPLSIAEDEGKEEEWGNFGWGCCAFLISGICEC